MRSPEPAAAARARGYVARETAISVAVNAGFSLAFFLIVFGWAKVVPVRGIGAYAFDALPQTFAIATMGTLVPGAITAHRLRKGAIAGHGNASTPPRRLVARTLATAVAATLVCGGAVCAGLLVFGPATIDWWPAVLGKVIYGAVLAGVVSPPGLRAALRGV